MGEVEPSKIALEFSQRVWYFSGEVVPVEVKVFQLWEITEGSRDWTRELVVTQIEVVQVLELAEEFRDGAGEWSPVETKQFEVPKFGDGVGDGTIELGDFIKGEGFKIGKVTDGGWNLAGDVGLEEGELGNSVSLRVADDVVPITAINFGIPGEKGVGIVYGFLDSQKDLLIMRIATNRRGEGERWERS
uniref:Uncharacterized protein n=1 Tax=Nelumbo nucifera TaxID=4432 RepID=A0A822YG10_NELNU|nr:TPA_asm: hypothetical protein HUJ06_031383 [Nelumbo nucifera]